MNTPEPLDPNSPKGREVAERFSRVFAEIVVAVLAREAREAVERRAA